MDKSRILLYDIETSPIISYNWGIWEQNAIKVIQDWQILCFSYKWLDEKKVYVLGQDDLKGYKPGKLNDKALVTELHKLFDEAAVVVAHNGNAFDQKKVRARMMVHGLTPPSPYRELDTRNIARRVGAFTSNKLDALGGDLALGHKLSTGGFQLWEKVMAGDKKAWLTMKRYNKQDVALLEAVYLRLRPWIANHPAVNVLKDEPNGCPKCGSTSVVKNGLRYTQAGTYQEWLCRNCGGYCRTRTMDKRINKMAYAN